MRAMRDMERHMTLPEPQRSCDGTKTLHPRNILVLWTCRLLDRLLNPEQTLTKKMA